MKINNVEQGSLEWLALRRCKVTGTKLKDVMGTPQARIKLIAELIAEEATEQSKNVRTSPEMERGSAEEPFAIREFMARTGKKVERVGICISDDFPWLACSPDGLIGKKKVYNEALEIKCPESSTAIYNRIANMVSAEELGTKAKLNFIGVPEEYKWQMVNYFLVNEKLQILNFAIYDARFIDQQEKMYIIKVERDNPALQEAIMQAKEELVRFRKDWLSWKEIVLPSNF